MPENDLFARDNAQLRPLADRMRPATLDEFIGQTHLLAAGKPLRKAIESGRLHSMIFWGPPGTGKTTLARLLAGRSGYAFETLSAVLSGVKDIRAAVDRARERRTAEARGTVLFIDEVHRFNKSQQDAFLPHVEDGTVILIGATTENPSFEVNSPLLSRSRVVRLQALSDNDIRRILVRALNDQERGLGKLGAKLDDDALDLPTAVPSGTRPASSIPCDAPDPHPARQLRALPRPPLRPRALRAAGPLRERGDRGAGAGGGGASTAVIAVRARSVGRTGLPDAVSRSRSAARPPPGATSRASIRRRA